MGNNQNLVTNKVKFGIRLKFFISIISIILFVSLSIVFSSMLLAKRELENEIEKRGLSDVKNLVYDAKYGGFTKDKVILSRLITGRMRKSDIVYVIITNESGRILATESKGNYESLYKDYNHQEELEKDIFKTFLTSDEGENIYEFTAPIVLEEDVYDENSDLFEDIIFIDELDKEKFSSNTSSKGSVKLGISLKNMETKMAEILFINILIIFIVITIAIIIALIFIKMMVSPIMEVTQAAMDISNGDLSIVVKVKSSDEISIMADNFNKMTTSFRNTIAELEQLKVELEQKVDSRTNDLKLTINELEKAYNDLKKLDEMKTNFISSVSHELRTPLTSIVGFAKLMKSSLRKQIMPRLDMINLDQNESKTLKSEFDEIQEGVEIIVSEGDRLTRLINDVLDIAKMEAGKVDWKNEIVILEDIVNFAINSTNCLVKGKDVEIIFNNNGIVHEIFYDRDKLIQVVLNLLNNAVKFTDFGQVVCSILNKDNIIEVEIADTGRGISKNEVPQIFDKFKQVGDTLTDKPAGSGLGLPICKEIVKHYGGEIWVKSKLGKGSSFFFTIPTLKTNTFDNNTEVDLVSNIRQNSIKI